ncbi:hypothetical protein FB566_3430 [Stackebrandtia endophytica]|uniref:DUF3592 domain-containing protein n=1 Tax=Stackebrandtia endophytica TaxID=1496996 RepID=A0A543AZ66_9ACTN|nr:hypothetical protein [Stackebrandtia endophytica]TQL77862.1 hypothetical protein FB566_3430 [Stackebrandtia endophytica]
MSSRNMWKSMRGAVSRADDRIVEGLLRRPRRNGWIVGLLGVSFLAAAGAVQAFQTAGPDWRTVVTVGPAIAVMLWFGRLVAPIERWMAIVIPGTLILLLGVGYVFPHALVHLYGENVRATVTGISTYRVQNDPDDYYRCDIRLPSGVDTTTVHCDESSRVGDIVEVVADPQGLFPVMANPASPVLLWVLAGLILVSAVAVPLAIIGRIRQEIRDRADR